MREGSTLKSEWIHVGFNHGYLHKHNEKIMSNIVEDYKKNGITAIFAANDRIASFFILSALKLGYQIPDDFSIIGFDNDTTLNTIHSKQITTMSQQYDKIGKLAAHNIVNLIEGKTDNVKITVEAKLIEKETCIKRISLKIDHIKKQRICLFLNITFFKEMIAYSFTHIIG